jgi:L-iditol 2-dehydrogenase
MRVVRLHSQGQFLLHDEPEQEPVAGEVRLKVKAVGICGSDLHWFTEGKIGDAELESPLILGHEFAANTDRGERVAVDPAISCGQCEQCRSGKQNLCPQVKFAGHGTQDGALREYMPWPQDHLYHLPDALSDSDGAMLEPLGIAIHALDLSKLHSGMSVGVFGCGPIGLLIVQLARLSGAAQIIATDKLNHRVEAAKSLGAHQAILANAGQELSEIQAVTKGRGVDVAFEVAGEQDAVDVSVAAVLPGGKVILVGIPADDHTSFTASIARRKGLTLKLVRRMNRTYPRAIELVSKALVDVRSLVTHHFSLEKTAEAFSVAVQREGLKVMIEM